MVLRGGTHPVELGGDALGQALLALTLSGGAGGLGLEIGGVVDLIGVEVTAVDLADPLGHMVEEVAVMRDGLTLSGGAGGLGLEIGGVVDLIGVEVTAVDLADPLGHMVEEVAVMRDGEHGAGVVLEEVLEPQDGLGVQVVGGLVEQQQVGGLEQQLAQGHAAALTAGEHVHRHVGIGQLKGVHGLAELGVDIPAVGGVNLVLQTAHLGHEGVHVAIGVAHLDRNLVEALDLGDHIGKSESDVLDDGLVLIQRRLLLQDAHRVTRGEAGIAVGDLLETGHDLEQRGLAHTVGAHDADLGTGIERQGHVVEDDLVAMRLARLVHLINELCH